MSLTIVVGPKAPTFTGTDHLVSGVRFASLGGMPVCAPDLTFHMKTPEIIIFLKFQVEKYTAKWVCAQYGAKGFSTFS